MTSRLHRHRFFLDILTTLPWDWIVLHITGIDHSSTTGACVVVCVCVWMEGLRLRLRDSIRSACWPAQHSVCVLRSWPLEPPHGDYIVCNIVVLLPAHCCCCCCFNPTPGRYVALLSLLKLGRMYRLAVMVG